MGRTLYAVVALCAAAGFAPAATMTATFTADNHYAMYASGQDGLTLVGGNELGYAGDPGVYNWSFAETFTFESGPRVYVAAWSDDQYYQALLGQLSILDGETILTGDARWRVFPTDLDRNDGDPYPTATEIAAQVALADGALGWQQTFVGGSNGVGPWGAIAGVSSEARWIWWNTPGDSDPIAGGSGSGEFIIFRLETQTIPTPGAIALMGLGGLLVVRRRR